VSEYAGRAHVGGDGLAIHVHGDLHLGQLLRQNERFAILDFEGEPLASVEDRMGMHSPLKDVAGMLRSLDYAVGHARRNGAPGEVSAWERWTEAAEDRFMASYVGRSSDLLPSRPAHRIGLLYLYLIEKATYEIAYELQARPDWVEIPLRGLDRVIRRVAMIDPA